MLDTFNEERYPIIKNLIKGTDLATRFMFAEQPLIRSLRLTLFAFFIKLYPVRKKINVLLSETQYNYEHSSIVSEHWNNSNGFKAGDRVPNEILSIQDKKIFLFDLLQGTSSIILIFSSSPQAVLLKKQMAHFAKAYIVSRDSRVYESFGLYEGVYIIRPDGYVGFRADFLDTDGCVHYFDTILKK